MLRSPITTKAKLPSAACHRLARDPRSQQGRRALEALVAVPLRWQLWSGLAAAWLRAPVGSAPDVLGSRCARLPSPCEEIRCQGGSSCAHATSRRVFGASASCLL